MAQAELIAKPPTEAVDAPACEDTPAAGVFGYSIYRGEMRTFRSTAGYLRDMEQMPNFSPPSVERFVKQYLASYLEQNEAQSSES